jgi:hypothetical protein
MASTTQPQAAEDGGKSRKPSALWISAEDLLFQSARTQRKLSWRSSCIVTIDPCPTSHICVVLMQVPDVGTGNSTVGPRHTT